MPSWNIDGLDPITGQDKAHATGFTIIGVPTVDAFGDYQGSATGEQDFDISYTATDNGDNATGTAHYHLTLHDPVENIGADEHTHYRIEAPMKEGNNVLVWYGPRTADYPEQTVKIATSTETGYDLTATTSVDVFKALLGFSAEAHITSTQTLSIDTEATVPAIAAGHMVYLIAIHDFQRQHSRFFRYDESGEIRRMISRGPNGQVYNPPILAYHEAFRDTAGRPQYRWSDDIPNTVGVNNLPQEPIPPLEYDYS